MFRWSRFDLVFGLALLVAVPVAGEVRVDVGRAVPDADGRVIVEVRLRTDGESVGGFQNDILFDNRILALDPRDCLIHPSIGLRPPGTATDCLDDPAIGPCKNLNKGLTSCGGPSESVGCPPGAGEETSVFRAIVAATAAPNGNSIPDGPVYTCTFEVIDPAALPALLINSNIVAADPFGTRLAATGADGFVTRGDPSTPPPTRTPTAPGLKRRGEPCASSAECVSGLRCNHEEGGICCSSEKCPAGETCRRSGFEGLCLRIPATPTPTPPPKTLGEGCGLDYECRSGSCVDGACCTQPRCLFGESCNVSGAEGTCAPRRGEGQDCSRNTDCTSNNCRIILGPNDGSTGECAPPLREIDPIMLIVGPAVELGPGPQFVAVADFNGDDLDDAAVSNPAGILLSNGIADFDAPIAFPAEPKRGPIAVVDLNRDGSDDVVALVSESPTLVFNLSQGGGSFAESASVPLPSVPVALTASDLEGDGVPEVIVTGVDGVLRILRDTTADGLQLAVAQSIDLGGNLTEVALADVDSDGLRDLLVLDAAGSGGLIVLLNRGEAGFDRHNVPLAGDPVGMAVADFDDDAVREVAVLSTRGGSEHLALLANGLEPADPVSSFVERHSFPVSCPGSFSGQPTACAVRDIVAGDFNFDGLADLAVAISTRLMDSPNVQVPGLVQAFIGLGDGNFVFSVRVNVGPGPERLAVGDFDGDLRDDLLVAENGIDPVGGSMSGSRVRVVRATTPGLPIGDGVCRQHRQCASGACVDGVCCLSQRCPEGERCDILGFEGRCAPPLPVDSTCSTTSDCSPGLLCAEDGFGKRCTIFRHMPTPIAAPPAAGTNDELAAIGDEGCHVSARPADSRILWPLVAAGLLVLVRLLCHRARPIGDASRQGMEFPG